MDRRRTILIIQLDRVGGELEVGQWTQMAGLTSCTDWSIWGESSLLCIKMVLLECYLSDLGLPLFEYPVGRCVPQLVGRNVSTRGKVDTSLSF